MKKLLAALTLAFALSTASATEYFVRTDGHDTNCNGTADAPDGGAAPNCAKLTISGVAGGTTKLTTAGDILTVGDGSYPDPVVIPHKTGSSSAHYVIRAQHTGLATIANTLTYATGTSNKGQYVDVIGFKITASSRTAIHIDTSTGSSAQTWANISLSYITIPSIGTGASITGRDCLIDAFDQHFGPGIVFDHFTISNGGVAGDVHAWCVHVNPSGTTPRTLTISNSDVTDIGFHILLGSSKDETIYEYNYFHNILCDYGGPPRVPPISPTDGDGCFQGYNSFEIIRYNVFNKVSSKSSSIYGVTDSRRTQTDTHGGTTQVYHNTFISWPQTTPGLDTLNPAVFSPYTANNQSTSVWGNIFIGYGNTVDTTGLSAAWMLRTCSLAAIDGHNNLYYNNVADITDPNGCIISPGGHMAGDVFGQDPQLDPLTFIPAIGSPACNAAGDGTAIGAKNCPSPTCE